MNRNIATLIDKIYLNRNYGFQIAGLFTDAIVNDELKEIPQRKFKEITPFLE
ncbi:hypothetical protein [uncultured Polaribacter sp.]|uniref:hypothetical protein n=1 Tax=uncultured Polaribacter sp. TaxID=174711 RepID=UPI002636D54D|nr:hypothetical protein [uncultured Polaribacter sp.]